MPGDHADIIEALQPTIATIDPKMPDGYRTTDQWRRDIIHKWAHKMQQQASGTVRRYNLVGSREWRSRTRRLPRQTSTIMETPTSP